MSEIREILVDTTTRVMKDMCTKELIDEAENGKWPEELWKTLEQSGMTTVGVSEETGGSGGTIADAMHMIKIAGEFAAPVPLAETLMANWFLDKAELSPMKGPLTVSFAYSNDQVLFTESANGWSFSGKLRSIPWARAAEHIVVIAEWQEGEMLTVIVDSQDCLIEHGENLAGEPRDTVTFHNIPIPKQSASLMPLGSDDRNLIGATVRSSMMAGALQRLLDLSVTYAKERKQFGRSIGRFQAVQQQLAILSGEATASHIAASAAIESYETNEDSSEEDSISAKIRIGEAAGTASAIAHQIHGAIGFTDEHALHQMTRRLWSWRDEFGNENVWAVHLGEKVIENGDGNLLELMTNTMQ